MVLRGIDEGLEVGTAMYAAFKALDLFEPVKLEVKYDALMLEDRVQTALVREEMTAVPAALART